MWGPLIDWGHPVNVCVCVWVGGVGWGGVGGGVGGWGGGGGGGGWGGGGGGVGVGGYS